MNINDKIMKAQKEMIDSLRAEVKRLKVENKITEEEYYKRLQEIVDMQNENQKLVIPCATTRPSMHLFLQAAQLMD